MSTQYWRMEDLGGVELLHAEGSTHRYARHSHEGYAIGVVEAGAHAFTARGELWTAVPGRIVVVNPDQAHDGGPATRDGGYAYRMIYVDARVVGEIAADAAGDRDAIPFFRESVVTDPALAEQILTLHRALEWNETLLERETRLNIVLGELVRRHGCVAAPSERRAPASKSVSIAREYIEANFASSVSLAQLAALTGMDRFRLLRAFGQSMGLPPHRYQTQLRLRHARRLLLAGESPVMAAAGAGFADQSHLIRKFKAAYGVTPGQYLCQRNNVQSDEATRH